MVGEGSDIAKIFGKLALVQDSHVAQSGVFQPFCHASPPHSRADKQMRSDKDKAYTYVFPKSNKLAVCKAK